MFNLKRRELTALDETMTMVLAEMKETNPSSPEFHAMLERLERLSKLRAQDAQKRVSPDTLAIVVGNLAGILLILNYERAHVVTSKALGFVMKLR